MIRNLQTDKETEISFLTNLFEGLKNTIKQHIENFQNCISELDSATNTYIEELSWILDHIDFKDKRILKSINCINSDIVRQTKGFELIILNQESQDLKIEIVNSYIQHITLCTSKFKNLEITNDQ